MDARLRNGRCPLVGNQGFHLSPDSLYSITLSGEISLGDQLVRERDASSEFLNATSHDIALVKLQYRVSIGLFSNPISIAAQMFGLNRMPTAYRLLGKIDMYG